jgi:hypothetical protein
VRSHIENREGIHVEAERGIGEDYSGVLGGTAFAYAFNL